jgi:hypothetical protein
MKELMCSDLIHMYPNISARSTSRFNGFFPPSHFSLLLLVEAVGTLSLLSVMRESDINPREIVESWVQAVWPPQFRWAIFAGALTQNSLKAAYDGLLTS